MSGKSIGLAPLLPEILKKCLRGKGVATIFTSFARVLLPLLHITPGRAFTTLTCSSNKRLGPHVRARASTRVHFRSMGRGGDEDNVIVQCIFILFAVCLGVGIWYGERGPAGPRPVWRLSPVFRHCTLPRPPAAECAHRFAGLSLRVTFAV